MALAALKTMAAESLRLNFPRLEVLANRFVCCAPNFAENFIFLISPDTSKNSHATAMHGGQGTFLSSLAALSILTLTSHHQAHHSHSTLILHHSRPAARLVPAPKRHSLSSREHGTRVHVQNLFGNMPVRVKQRALTSDGRGQEKMWDRLSHKLVALILAWGTPVTLVLRNLEGVKKLLVRGRGDPRPIHPGIDSVPSSFDISIVRSVLSQAGCVEPSDWSKWIETSVITPSINIHGAISLQPAPSKRVQFISIGIHLVDPNPNKFLYDEINQHFAASDFGKEEDNSELEDSPRKKKGKRLSQSGVIVKRPREVGKGADRWPMFAIRIDLLSTPKERWKCDLESERECALLGISIALEGMITRFLNDHHFRPHKKRSRLHNKPDDGPPLPSRIDSSTAGSQHARDGIHTLISTDVVSLVENHEPATDPSGTERSNHVTENKKTYVASARGDFPSRPMQSQKSSRQDLYFEHGFSTWSRIKSGKRENLDELLSQKITKGRKKEHLRDVGAEVDLMAPKSPPNRAIVSGTESISQAADQDDPHETSFTFDDRKAMAISEGSTSLHDDSVAPNESENDDTLEDTIQWTNPITGATTVLSARTGLEVRRPWRQPSKTSQTSNRRIDKPRLTHRLSDPFGNLKEGSWVSGLLKNWNNPVFKPCEESIPLLSFEELNSAVSSLQQGRFRPCSDSNIQKAFSESSSLLTAKLSKDALSHSTYIAQVDRKYLLVCMDVRGEKGALEENRVDSQRFLVLIDQHAADERIRVEGLLADLCRGPNPETSTAPTAVHPQSAIATIILSKPITFTVRHSEHSLFTAYAFHFADWGILYGLEARAERENPGIVQPKGSQLTVIALPQAIAERCRADSKILIDLLRTEAWKCKDAGLGPKTLADHSLCSLSPSRKITCGESGDQQDQLSPNWLRRVRNCPQGILDMINSRACRSAIMFNDALTEEECKLLLGKLAKCAFPFQCAHGRPSMVPLVRVGEGDGDGLGIARRLFKSGEDEGRRDIEKDFRRAWRTWMDERKREGEEEGIPNG